MFALREISETSQLCFIARRTLLCKHTRGGGFFVTVKVVDFVAAHYCDMSQRISFFVPSDQNLQLSPLITFHLRAEEILLLQFCYERESQL